jgi:hypothetical protein
MSAISTANLARLQTASPEAMRAAAVEAVLTLAQKIEDDDTTYQRSTRLLATRFRHVIEEVLQ